MTLLHFQLLNRKNQMKIIWEEGALIGTRSTIFYAIELYQVDGFYVEIFYKKEEQEFALLRSFDSTDRLTPYLNQIRVMVEF